MKNKDIKTTILNTIKDCIQENPIPLENSISILKVLLAGTGRNGNTSFHFPFATAIVVGANQSLEHSTYYAQEKCSITSSDKEQVADVVTDFLCRFYTLCFSVTAATFRSLGELGYLDDADWFEEFCSAPNLIGLGEPSHCQSSLLLHTKLNTLTILPKLFDGSELVHPYIDALHTCNYLESAYLFAASFIETLITCFYDSDFQEILNLL